MQLNATYNRFAGQSLERLSALSDGIFAVALTLLVLDLRIPDGAAIHSEAGLWHSLVHLSPRFVSFLMTFLTLGIFWVGQQTQLNQFERADRDLAWIHLAFLLCVSLMPFSTGLLAEFITFRMAIAVYWLNMLGLGATLFASWRYARHAKLVKDTVTPAMHGAISRRIVVAQAMYAAGAALCVINTHVSIAVIFFVQLNFVFAPRIRSLYRL